MTSVSWNAFNFHPAFFSFLIFFHFDTPSLTFLHAITNQLRLTTSTAVATLKAVPSYAVLGRTAGTLSFGAISKAITI